METTHGPGCPDINQSDTPPAVEPLKFNGFCPSHVSTIAPRSVLVSSTSVDQSCNIEAPSFPENRIVPLRLGAIFHLGLHPTHIFGADSLQFRERQQSEGTRLGVLHCDRIRLLTVVTVRKCCSPICIPLRLGPQNVLQLHDQVVGKNDYLPVHSS